MTLLAPIRSIGILGAGVMGSQIAAHFANAGVSVRLLDISQAIAGEGLNNWLDEAAVLGLWEVIKKYSYFREQFQETLDEIDEAKPNSVVLIDYPGFNLRLARALRQRSPKQKIIYYISPQVWAWNRGRIAKMARFLDLMLCIFPFEAELYNKSGLRTEFVGHPMIDRLRPLTSKRNSPQTKLWWMWTRHQFSAPRRTPPS